MSDDLLVAETKRVAAVERQSTADLLALLIEVENRRLHFALGYSSLFVFSTKVLRLSEQAAYSRITAARAARRFPVILTLLAEGALTLSSVGILAPHLTDENADALFESARDKSSREVERLIASLHAQPDIDSSVRALPVDRAETPAASGARPSLLETPAASKASPTIQTPARPVIAPIAARRYLLKVTISQETHDKLQRARALLRHTIPDGDPAVIFDRALTLLVEQSERTKFGTTSRPRRHIRASDETRRHVPASVRRTVWKRDGGRCAFVGTHGRCDEAAFLEFHHVVPFAAGGRTVEDNLQLRCRAHNAHEAVIYFGATATAARRENDRRD